VDPRNAFFAQPTTPTANPALTAPAADPRDAFFGQPTTLTGSNR
jgi:hypothetical protein